MREELIRTQADVEKTMIDLHDEEMSHMISLGGWLRGFQLAANSCAQSYSRGQSAHPRPSRNHGLLHRPARYPASATEEDRICVHHHFQIKSLRDLAADAEGPGADGSRSEENARSRRTPAKPSRSGPVDSDGKILFFLKLSVPSARRFLAAVDDANVRAFRGLVDRFLEETHERFPRVGKPAGPRRVQCASGPERRSLPIARRFACSSARFRRPKRLPEASFAGDDWLDRRTFLAMLRTELLNDRDLQRWRNNPQTHCDAAVDSIFDLVIRNARDLGAVLPAIESRLATLSDYLAAGATCVNRPVPLWTKLAQRSCEGAAQFLR